MLLTPISDEVDFDWDGWTPEVDSIAVASPLTIRTQPFRPRRAHTKSRGGCRECKQRRNKVGCMSLWTSIMKLRIGIAV